ncbi:hypothetical protein CGLO_12176 [Colletotrichum gloeosporioides Cg-14]|uniref:Uncharacterized protein n=1 Tax=Colletotrichum gloeosporioides (strain Cg-14) TaxID=1237896 RepID=T0LK58_COLGC|nr:hypothetical protein CGLO_12176 [Colletotrichum gloeosporioides Cg-14]
MSSDRVTPPPECSIAPQTTAAPDACAALRAWHWDGCPAGFSPRAAPRTAWPRTHSRAVLDYGCRESACIASLTSSRVLTYPGATTTLKGEVTGHAIAASRAEIRLAGVAYAADDPRSDTEMHGAATTVWCDSERCADVPAGVTTEEGQGAATATVLGGMPGADGFALRPPPGMGALGPFGVYAVTALFGAVVFAGGLLGPWGWAGWRRRRGR